MSSLQQFWRFPAIWKKANVVPVHKKEDKNLLKNYRPISLLPIFSKIFERIIYNSLFNHFQSSKRFTSSQSGFLPGDSCIAQLLSIIHEIQTAFDNNPTVDVRSLFLDISKVFDKVWHSGLLFKLQVMGLKVNYLPNVWPNVWLEKNKLWSTTRVSVRTSFIFDFHKWSSWWNNSIM